MNFTKEVHEILKGNRRKTAGHQYTVPSPNTYPYQWFWDSCFHAIVLSKLEPEAAKEELRSLVSKQFDNGLIPHIIYWQPGDLHRFEWGKDGTSTITQPPMLCSAVWSIYEKTKDKDFLKEMQKPLAAFYHYLIKERDKRKHHIISIINPDESGEDNSPRFDSSLNISNPQISLDEHLKKRLVLVDDNRTCRFDAINCMEKFFWVKDVPFNSILVENLRIFGEISAILKDSKNAKFAKENKELISKTMREKMCEDGIFWSTENGEYKKIKINTWSHFAPLFAGIYTKVEAENLVRNYLMDENSFLSLYGIRTVSKKEPSYNPEGVWRGSIWIAVQWFIYKGLKNYGFDKEADMIKKQTEKLIKKEGFREYYNPETGKGLGASNFTWGTLVADMS
ncbi:MAG: trehalase family glycosidase [Candidatus Paceibacterota bacterium]